MENKEIDLEDLKQVLKELKFEMKYSKPFGYQFFKPHLRDKVDNNLNNFLSNKVHPLYEILLTDKKLIQIANQTNWKETTEIYNLLIVEDFKSKLYKKFPSNYKSYKIFL